MNFLWWLTGVLAVITGMRFLMTLFKKLGSKENFNMVIDSAGRGISHGAEKLAETIKKKKEAKKHEEGHPIVTIH